MEHNLDHIFNQIPQKSIYLYQVGEQGVKGFTLGVEFDHEHWKNIQEQYQWKITKILLRRTNEAQYNSFYHMVHSAHKNDVACNLYHLLSNSHTTIHMN